jgi:hypothetical protein
MKLPFFGLAYGLAGTACILWGLRKNNPKILRALGAVILFFGAFNAYAETWKTLRRISFENATFLLLAGFLCVYTWFTLQLMEQAGIARGRAAFVSSFLPVVYLFILGFGLNLQQAETLENPPFVAYVFLVLVLFIHVPAFAFGKSKATQTGSKPTSPVSPDRKNSNHFFPKALFALATPLLITLVVQITMRDDWRLFGSNAAATSAILLLLASATKRQSDFKTRSIASPP